MSKQLHSTMSDRRRFLLAMGVVASTALESSLIAPRGANAAAPTVASKPVLLRPSNDHNLFRVRVELEVEGNVNVPKNSLVSKKSDLQIPIKSTATLDYEERFFRTTDSTRVTLAQRHYHEATSESTLNRTEQSSRLRESVRSVIVRRGDTPELIYSTDDYFQRDELDLLRLPASSMGLDDLLPIEAVTAGATYIPTTDAMKSVLSLSSVEASDVVADVVSITDDDAKITFQGTVDGSIDGVPTTVRTVGKLTFDRRSGVCIWLAMAVHETREIGKAEPGFDVAATIKLLRKPLDKPIALSATPPKLTATDPIPQDRLYVELTSKELGVSVLMDRRWRVMSDVPGAAMMRMIENDRSIAQCDFRPLASLPAGTQWTLAAFQQDIKKTLGEQLGQFVSAEERVSETGLRALRVTASGAVENVPIQWVVLHLSDDSGRRMLATFTMEAKNADVFAGSDHQLGGSLRLLDPAVVRRESVTKTQTAPRPPRIGKASSSGDSKGEVQSASDLKL